MQGAPSNQATSRRGRRTWRRATKLLSLVEWPREMFKHFTAAITSPGGINVCSRSHEKVNSLGQKSRSPWLHCQLREQRNPNLGCCWSRARAGAHSERAAHSQPRGVWGCAVSIAGGQGPPPGQSDTGTPLLSWVGNSHHYWVMTFIFI